MFRRYWWLLFCTPLAVALVALLVAFLVQVIGQKTYESSAVLQVRPGKTGDGPITRIVRVSVEAEVGIIKSTRTLDLAVDSLDLTNVWDTDEESARRRLADSIRVANLGDTDLIKLSARSGNPLEARQLAEAVSAAYQQRRTELEQERSNARLDELGKAVAAQEELVEEKRKVLTELIRNKRLIYTPDPQSAPKGVTPRGEELDERLTQLESQIDTLLRYDGDALISYAAGLDIPENRIKELQATYLNLKRDMEEMTTGGLGRNHPTIVTIGKQIEHVRKSIKEELMKLKDILTAQLELVREQKARLGEEAPPSSPSSEIRREAFDDARKEFENSRDLAEHLRIKRVGEEIGARIADSGVITHSDPEEPIKPVRPAMRPLALATGGGGVLGLILAIPLMALLNSRAKKPPPLPGGAAALR